MPITINGATSGSTTITAPDTGSDETIELSTALDAKAPSASPTFTGNLVWSDATLRADTNAVATTQTTTSTSYTDLATAGPSVTVTTGTKALVIVGAFSYNSAVGNSSFMSAAVSGASTVAASDDICFSYAPATSNTDISRASRAILLTGLTAGSNTFTAKYRASGGTASFGNRTITVIDMGS
jgi:hypothetical protein